MHQRRAGANDITAQLKCAKYLLDTPENAYIKCASATAAVNDLNAELKCAKLLPSNLNGASNNMTNTTTSASATAPFSNTSLAITPNNTSTTTSGGKAKGTTCAAGNCTSGIAPPVDCTKTRLIHHAPNH